MIRMSPAMSAAAMAAILLSPLPTAAQPQRRAPAATAPLDAARLASLENFIDGVMAQQLATREVAGAVVTVVHGGRVIVSRGYGYADIDRGVKVDPTRTLFRPGSVGKLLTWVTLMQQVEAGRVRLDADVNDYLDFRIPAFEGKPIRVRDLLQHTPGMSDLGNFSAETADKLVPYNQWIKTHVPKRLWAPGTETSYSNYGAALAGYIVERVSGIPFADYIEQRLFTPLGMTSTTFREPLPPALAPRMALGYRVEDGRFVAQPFELYSAIMPAGSDTSSGTDMAKFMMMILNNGQLGAARVLKPESVRLLTSDSFGNVSGLPPMAHGFMVRGVGTTRLVGHGGNTGDFHSDLVLSPQHGFGFFISTTGGPGSYGARTELAEAIIGRMFPQAPTPAYAGSEADGAVIGSYRANRRDYDREPDPKRDIKVSLPRAGTVLIDNGITKTQWRRVGPATYEQITNARDGGPYDRITFYRRGDGVRMSYATQPHMTWHLVQR